MSAMPATFQRRRSTKKVDSRDAFPTLYHRINQPKPPPSRLFNPPDRGLYDSSILPSSAFPALSRFFRTFLVAAHLPLVKAGGISEELSNNIITDLAPFLALFGEQVTKQFMSQSMGVTDNIIFACAPLGIVTAIVGAIRVGGSKTLKAIIGRARESRSGVEIELMSSTSNDVCEMWDGNGVVKALGEGPIMELIYLAPKESRYGTVDIETQKIWTEGDFGIYDFHSAKASVLELRSPNYPDGSPDVSSSAAPLITGIGAAPNMSMNFGGEVVHDIEVFAVAALGVILQLGVVVYAVLSFALSPWKSNFQKTGYQPTTYAPLMICGTVALVIGMYLCSHVVERSTVEESWNVKGQTLKQAKVKIAWLQQGGVVGDHAFDSYALFPMDPVQRNISPTRITRILRKYFSPVGRLVYGLWKGVYQKAMKLFQNKYQKSSQSSQVCVRTSRQIQTTPPSTLVNVAVFVSLCGFVGQFLGLRGLHWSVTVSQLVATCIMTVLRASIRRNLLQEPKAVKLHLGYELDWMAREGIKKCAHWSVVTWGFDRSSHFGDRTPVDTLATATMTARRRLSALSKWPSQWRETTDSTTTAIEGCMNFMFYSADITTQGDWSERDRFEWKIVVQVGLRESKATHLEEVTLTLKRIKMFDGAWGPWRAVRSEIEAVIGLWMLYFDVPKLDANVQGEAASDWENDDNGRFRGKPILRVLGPYGALERIGYENWIGRETNYTKVIDITTFTEGKAKACDMAIGGFSGVSENDVPVLGDPVLGIITTSKLDRICGQVLFSQFMLNMADYITTIGGKVNIREGVQGLQTSFGLSCAGLTGLAEIVEQTALANTEEAYMSILPAVSGFGKLPYGPNDTEPLFRDIVKAANVNISEGRLEQAECCRLWLLHVAELAVDVYKHRKDWRRAGDVYLHLRQESKHLLHGTDHIEDVNQRITLFCEQVFTAIAIGGRMEGGQTMLSDKHRLVGTCMTKSFGVISETTLASWKSSAEGVNAHGVVKEEQLRQAITEGKGFRVEVLLEDGADIEACGRDKRTPLVLACISGHGGIARQLIKRHADINAKDYHHRTPLHHAAQKGHTSIVQNLLVSGSIKINARDKMGFSSLDLAVQQNAGAAVSLLLFYGAEDLDGHARKCSQIAAEKGSEAGVQEMLVKALNFDLADPEYGRTPLHWAAWNASRKALELLLVNQANRGVTDRNGDTPLHVAVMAGSIAGLRSLLQAPVDIHTKGHRGETSLHKAASVGHKTAVQLLLDKGANIEARDNRKQTPLHQATSNGHSEVMQLLLDRGADKETKDDDQRTPLHFAATNGHSTTVDLLLGKTADKEAKDRRGRTPLHSAAEYGHTTTVELLLDRAADKEAKNDAQRTPLHFAATNGHSTTVELLLDRGADKEAKEAITQRTPLHFAAENGHSTTVELLLDRGADKEAKEAITQRTPLHFAAENGHSTTVELLLDRGADKEAKVHTQRTPLHFAADYGHSTTVELLLDRGADKEAKDAITQQTPLHFAAENGHSTTVELLLDRGANKEAKSNFQWTPLHCAAENGHSTTVELLLDRGADKEAKGQLEKTPLHYAARNGHSTTAELLLDRGANKAAKDISQRTPLHFAAMHVHSTTVELLLDRGADKEVKEAMTQWTPLHYAAENGHSTTVELLLDRGADKEVKDRSQQTPLHFAASHGHTTTVKLLLDRGANMEARDADGHNAIFYAKNNETRAAFAARERNANPPIASSAPN